MRTLAPVCLVLLSWFAGVPAYLILDERHILAPALRDRPWPLALLILAATALLVVTARAVPAVRRRARVAVALGAMTALASLAALVAVAHAAQTLPEASREIAVGRPLPSIALLDEQGHAFELGSLKGQPTVLLCFRGAWCPTCRAQLVELAKQARTFVNAGVRVIGVSPDAPEDTKAWRTNLQVPFPLLSDEKGLLAPDLCGANAHCTLLVDSTGVIRWGALNDNWRVTARPAVVLQAAYRLR